MVEGVRNGKGDIESPSMTVRSNGRRQIGGGCEGRGEAWLNDLHDSRSVARHLCITAFHDENSNGKLDTNFFGFPLEGFAFSN